MSIYSGLIREIQRVGAYKESRYYVFQAKPRLADGFDL